MSQQVRIRLMALALTGVGAGACIATEAAAQTVPPRIQDLIPDWANYVPATGPLTFSTPQGAAYWSPCLAIMGANARPVPIPDNGICGPNIAAAAIPAVTVSDGAGRIIFFNIVMAVGNSTLNGTGIRYSYTLTDTQIVRTTMIGGGINANVRIAGTTAVLGSGSALTLGPAVAQAMANANLAGLRGRILPPVVTTTGIVQSDVITGVSSVLTGRTDTPTLEDFIAGTSIVNGVRVLDVVVIGPVGRCAGRSSFNMSCEGGVQYSLPTGSTSLVVVLDTALTSTTTINRTVTSTGLATVDIPVAAYDRVHPAAQTSGFDQSDRFLARMLRSGDAGFGAALGRDGRLSMFLEGTAASNDYDARGGVSVSDGSFTGVRGGLAFAASSTLTIGAAGEGGRTRWTLHDAGLPESARGDAWRAGAFLRWSPGQWRVQAAGFGGRQQVRSTVSSTFGAGTSTARYDASVYGLGGEVGYAIPAGSFTLTPSIGIDWLGWRAPAFSETGGMAPLTVAAASREQIRPHIGLAADYRGEKVSLGAFARGTLVTGDRQGLVSARDGLSQAGSFAVTGPSSSREEAELGAHIDYALSPAATISISGNARIGSAAASYGGQIGVRVGF
jgi:outer membrane autotransporter protein